MDRPWATVRRAAVGIASEILGGHAVILAGSAADSTTMPQFLRDAGALSVLRLHLPAAVGGLADRLASIEALLASPPAAVVDKLNLIDPHHRAYVYAGSFTAVGELAGRRILGRRSPQHFAAEHKDRQDRLLGRHAHRIEFDADTTAEVARTVAAMAGDAPVVVQGIPSTALAIGASHTFAVPRAMTGSAIEGLLGRIARDCTAVMVTNVDHGTPCTYYGFVTPMGVLDFGPFEALVFWDPDTWHIVAPGITRPINLVGHTEHACRSAVHAMLHEFHEQTQYSGAFGADGTAADECYRTHDLNPRVCAGFAALDAMCGPPIPLAAVDLLLREAPMTVPPALWEALGQLAGVLRAANQPLIRLWDDSNPKRLPTTEVHAERTAYATRRHLVPLSNLT